jgi:hypothetical protein
MADNLMPIDKASAVGSPKALKDPDGLDMLLSIRDALFFLEEYAAENPALFFLRQIEILWLIRFVMQQHGLDCSTPYLSEEDWSRASSVEAIGNLVSALTPEDLSVLKVVLGPSAELTLVDSDAKRQRHLRRILRRAERSLTSSVAALRPETFREGMRRIAKAWTIPALAVVALVVFAVKITFNIQQPNLALHRPVIVSSTSSEEYSHVERLVDGDTTKIGFHTQHETNPHATIDLGESKRINRVVVYNRVDCCVERAVPLQVQVSDDGVRFTTVDERREPFKVWVANDLHARGRYVRLRVNAATSFHLNEVEIY